MPEATTGDRNGRIITFYSYKGGTGRSMALANVAWILASHGKRVLIVDWDLEAPGQHRYFHPFLEDKELTGSPGLIDYFYDVLSAATESSVGGASPAGVTPWWHEWTSWLRYTHPLNIPKDDAGTSYLAGSIALVPAGRQGTEYAERVAGFDWKSFYERLGGGVLLEAVKKRLREEYDYVLIDSRTGISDTAGVCTIQFPDDLVVCFTLNKQSMVGAAAVARSAASQRRLPNGQQGVRIWPVATRVELAERDRLQVARDMSHEIFWEHLGPLLSDRKERAVYWGRSEVLYQPYFAYEEVLAVFAEKRTQTSSMLASFEYLCSKLTDGAIGELVAMDEVACQEILEQYVPPLRRFGLRVASEPIAIIAERSSQKTARAVEDAIARRGYSNTNQVRNASAVIVLIGPEGLTPAAIESTQKYLERSKPVSGFLIDGAAYASIPDALQRVRFHPLPVEMPLSHLARVVSESLDLFQHEWLRNRPHDPEDPQRGKWGGRAEASGRALSVSATDYDHRYCGLLLRVMALPDARPLTSSVTFHLHPTFDPATVSVEPKDGIAELQLVAWGAFTVGAETDDGNVQLELDLSREESLPDWFRER